VADTTVPPPPAHIVSQHGSGRTARSFAHPGTRRRWQGTAAHRARCVLGVEAGPTTHSLPISSAFVSTLMTCTHTIRTVPGQVGGGGNSTSLLHSLCATRPHARPAARSPASAPLWCAATAATPSPPLAAACCRPATSPFRSSVAARSARGSTGAPCTTEEWMAAKSPRWNTRSNASLNLAKPAARVNRAWCGRQGRVHHRHASTKRNGARVRTCKEACTRTQRAWHAQFTHTPNTRADPPTLSVCAPPPAGLDEVAPNDVATRCHNAQRGATTHSTQATVAHLGPAACAVGERCACVLDRERGGARACMQDRAGAHDTCVDDFTGNTDMDTAM
jgi:hypothetical protein